MIKYLFLVSLFLLVFTSCNTITEKNTNYSSILNKYSKTDNKYKDLFDGNLTMEVIFISNEIKDALKKDIKENKLRKENIPFSIDKENASFLLAFYYYDQKLNNLDRDNTTWNITVKNNQTTYKSTKITKLFKSNYKIFKKYFLNNQRFSTFYLVEFKNLKLNMINGNMNFVLSSINAALRVAWRL